MRTALKLPTEMPAKPFPLLEGFGFSTLQAPYAARNNSLVNKGVDTSFGSNIRQFLNESAATTADKDKELGEVGRTIRKRVASIIDNSGVF